MRGTPFDFENFVGGLNTVDSPYTLQPDESRELMNVVSTSRGSIKKRNGSSVFASGNSAVFPVLVATDTFKRAPENPLSNTGKWTKLPTPLVTEAGRIVEEKLTTTTAAAGAYWNVAEQTNPAVSLEWKGGEPTSVRIFACLTVASEKLSGYEVEFQRESEGKFFAIIRIRTAEVSENLGTIKGLSLKAGNSFGITVRSGVVTGWVKREAWERVVEAPNATYTKGYGGFYFQKIGTLVGTYNNFAVGEVEAPATEAELTGLAPAVTAGGSFLVTEGGTKMFSVNTAGEITEIGSGFTEGKRWSVVQAPKTTAEPNQGPVYMVNGVDKPQYWTGAAKGTAVAVWKGVASEPKLTDGALEEGKQIVKSATAKFIASDVGKILTFETEVKEKNGTVIKTVLISEFIDSERVVVDIGIEGWKEAYSNIHFTIERAYYENATTKEHVPNGKYMVFLGNRIWMAGMSDDTSAVRFSEFAAIGEGGEQADPSAWPKNNVVRFDASDGQPITGLGVVGPYLLVFKAHKTWVVHDLDSGENRKISDTTGCVANRSIVETAGGTFFLTADQGIYLTNGSSLSEASYKVRPTILAINPANRENAAGAYFNNHYYLSFPSGSATKSNRTLDYDVQLKSWWLHDLTGNQWAIFEASSGEPFLYACPPRAKGGVVKAFVPGLYTDSGVNYTGNEVLGAFWLSAWEPFGYWVARHKIKTPFLKKRIRQVFFNGEGQIIPSLYRNFTTGERQERSVVANREISTEATNPTDFGASIEKWGEGTGIWGSEEGGGEVLWGGEQSVGAARIYAPGVAFVWGVGWGNNSAEPFTVHAYTMAVSFRKS